MTSHAPRHEKRRPLWRALALVTLRITAASLVVLLVSRLSVASFAIWPLAVHRLAVYRPPTPHRTLRAAVGRSGARTQQCWNSQSRAAVLDDRRRLARELHDGVIQELAYIRSASHTIPAVGSEIIAPCRGFWVNG